MQHAGPCRNSEKLLMASVACRRLSMVSVGELGCQRQRVGAHGSRTALGDSWGWPGPGLVPLGAAVPSPRIGHQMGALWASGLVSSLLGHHACQVLHSVSRTLSRRIRHTPALVTHSAALCRPAVCRLRLSAASYSKSAALRVTQSLARNQAPTAQLQECWGKTGHCCSSYS